MLTHSNITLFGEVQGVFLRRSVKHEAGRRGIAGFVRNERDNTVHIEVEGTEENLTDFVAWLRSGAGEGEGDYRIVEVDSEKGSFQGFTGFEIKE